MSAKLLADAGQLPAIPNERGNLERIVPTPGTVGQMGESAIMLITRPVSSIQDPALAKEVADAIQEAGLDPKPSDEVLITAYPVFQDETSRNNVGDPEPDLR